MFMLFLVLVVVGKVAGFVDAVNDVGGSLVIVAAVFQRQVAADARQGAEGIHHAAEAVALLLRDVINDCRLELGFVGEAFGLAGGFELVFRKHAFGSCRRLPGAAPGAKWRGVIGIIR